MNPLTKKSIFASSVIAATLVASIVLPTYFVYVVVLQLLAIIVVWKFFFEVSWKREVIIEKAKFLILPLVFNFGSLYLSTIFFQSFIKIFFDILVIGANFYLWTSLRKVHNLSDRAAIFHRNILIVISFMSIFLGSTALFRLFMLFGTTGSSLFFQLILIILIYALFYGISYFLAWENGADEDMKKLKPYILVISLLGAEVAWISSVWVVNYPVISTQEKANLGGTPLPAILLTIVFYFLWGIVFHKMDKSLSRRVLTEYFVLTLMFIAILLVTAKWLPSL
jgi:hypothetical protein